MAKGGLVEVGETSKLASLKRKRGISIFDLILRVLAIGATLGSASAMGTTEETLPFNTQFFTFQASYDDFDEFKLFVITNAIVCAYLALSLVLSISHIMRSHAGKSRVLLIFLDLTMLAFLTGGTSAATAIVYLAHNGNPAANWFGICQQYGDFCQSTSGSLIGSFLAILIFLFLIILSNVALSRR